jgi:site-specific DNA-methyltransferase (adenine-specific)
MSNKSEKFFKETAVPYLNTIQCGDCLKLLKELPADGIDLIITSPPYFQQRDYGGGIGNESTLSEYLDSLLEVVQECVRVVKPTGSIIYNLGDKYLPQNGLQLVPYRFADRVQTDLGLYLVNVINWHKSNPTPHQCKTRLVNATEPFFHFTRGKSYYYDKDSFEKTEPKVNETKSDTKGLRYLQLVRNSELSASEQSFAETEILKVIKEYQDGSLYDFRIKIRGVHAPAYGGQGGGRNNQLKNQGFTIIRMHGQKMKTDVLSHPVANHKNLGHSAIYPNSLIERIIPLCCPENGIVLDPYMGSGSTAIASQNLNRNFIGFELNSEYCELANERIKKNHP